MTLETLLELCGECFLSGRLDRNAVQSEFLGPIAFGLFGQESQNLLPSIPTILRASRKFVGGAQDSGVAARRGFIGDTAPWANFHGYLRIVANATLADDHS